MFCAVIVGLPGRYLLKNRPTRRAAVSVPPPGVDGMISLIDLPSNETGSALEAGHAKPTTAAMTNARLMRDSLIAPPLRACKGDGPSQPKWALTGRSNELFSFS